MKRIDPPGLLFGATSIIGFHLARLFPNTVVPLIPPGGRASLVSDWPKLQLEDPAWIKSLFQKHQPEVLLYCHAVCDVAKCQANSTWAYEVNVGHVQRVLDALPKKTRLVYISSDHVFGRDGVYTEASVPCPVSVYGKTRVEAEQRVLKRDNALVIRFGLAIGASADGRSGHLDWLRYRMKYHLPVTIIHDEWRCAVWAKDLAQRIMKLAHSAQVGIRHIHTTQVESRVALAKYLIRTVLEADPNFTIESRDQQAAPHLGRIALASQYYGELAEALPSVVEDLIETIV